MKSGDVVNGYTIKKVIGTGYYGSVYKVKKDDSRYAMKIMRRLLQTSDMSEVVLARDEISRLLGVGHPFIIHYIDSFRLSNCSETYIVMELCTGVNMKNAINTARGENKSFPATQIKNWLVQLLMAVAYLHHIRVVHREIKPNNIFLLEDKNCVKLGDLSLMKVLSLSANSALSSCRRERHSYRAPELWQSKSFRCNVDEWSLGCVLYELMSLKPPFDINNLKNITTANYEPIPPGQYHDEGLVQVMERLLTPDPHERPHASEILTMEVLNTARDDVQKMYENVLEDMPHPGIPEDTEGDFTPLEMDTEGRYPPQFWSISPPDSIVRHIWRDMVNGDGGTLAFQPYRLRTEFGLHTVLLYLVRREPDLTQVLRTYRQDMRIWVQTLEPPHNRLRLRFQINMHFPKLDGTPYVFEVTKLEFANSARTNLYNVDNFIWHELDCDSPPSANVAITSEWM